MCVVRGAKCVCACLVYQQSVNPYENLESYMNWEPHAWNDRPYVIAQGEGMLKHSDKAKWG